MSMMKLIIYELDNYTNFKQDISKGGELNSFMVLFNSSGRLERTSYGQGKNYFDISNLMSSISYNIGTVSYYEQSFLNVMEENENCEFVIEKNQVKIAMRIFRNVFFVDEEVEKELQQEEVKTREKQDKIRKDILIYDSLEYSSFTKSKMEESFEICLLSQVVNVNNTIDYAIDYKSINPEIKYMIDISNLLSNSIYESIFRVEKLLCELMNIDNINFCVSKEFEDIIKINLNPLFSSIIYFSEKSQKSEQESKLITSYTKNDVQNLFKQIRKEYFGHKDFMKELEDKIDSFILLSKLGRTKVFSALLCGDSGVGKTEIARLLHKHLCPGSSPIKLNFGNYTNQGSLWSLIGSPKGYIGSNEGGELTNKIKNSKSKVILIDEFDRADRSIFNFFYELLEDGVYTDLNGQIIDLTGYIIILTSNLNRSNYSEVIPESLLSRMDMTVEFKQLTREKTLEFINFTIGNLIDDYVKYLDEKGVILEQNRIDSIKSELKKVESTGENNLRRLKRMIFNRFSDFVQY